MTNREILNALTGVGALVTGSHIVYTSGRHGSAYVNKDAVYPHTRLTSQLCREMARRFAGEGVETVLAPAVGGVILSQWVAHHLSEIEGREIPAVYAEKAATTAEEGFVIKRGYDAFVRGRRVLVLEDILTTGVSVRKVVEAVRALGGVVVGVDALCNRGNLAARDLGEVPRLDSLIEIPLDSWEATQCPLCAKGVAINTSVGKGREFLAQQKKS